jgi:replicative DNA helicase
MRKVFTPEEAINYKGPDEVVHFTEYLEAHEKSLDKLKRFRCGFQSFDTAVDGLVTGEVIVITGHRKEGKTTFAESWMRSMLEFDPAAKAVILSYEMPPVQLLQKYKEDPSKPVFVPMSLKPMDFEWLERRCIEAKYKYMANIIMVDHLDHMVDMAVRQNVPLNIGAFMRCLKTEIAIKHNLAILLVAHQGQPRENTEPSVDTLRGSSSIGQESDATITVMRRRNLNLNEINDYRERYGMEIAEKVMPPDNANPDDESSANLAIVKVDCHRRTGAWKWKKLFRKVGDWMVEV